MDVINLAFGRTRAAVVPEAGGRLLQIEARTEGDVWTPLLVAPDDLDLLLREPLLWGCYPMAPWPGRVDGARFSWRGREYELPANDGAHSIHGRGVYLPWWVVQAEDAYCLLAVDLGPEQGWPFAAQALQHIGVVDDGVTLRLEIRAVDDAVFPAGAGWHPWFRRDVRSGHRSRRCS